MTTPTQGGVSSLARRVVLAALFSSSLLGGVTAFGAGGAQDREYQIKAAFILNFAKFIEWPEARFHSEDQPIVIGVAGQTPLAAELQNIVKDRKVRGRSVLVRSASTTADVADLHVLFFTARETTTFASVKTAAEAAGVLTVGESAEFEAAGGMITFHIEGDKVRFAINMESAERAHLKISAQLQQLAIAVRRAP